MDKIKINLDREKLSSEYIHSKQDFKQVQSQVSMQTSMFKSTWFYGTVGIASVATFVIITFSNSNPNTNDSNSTLSKKITLDKKQETLAERRSANVFLASMNPVSAPALMVSATNTKKVPALSPKEEEISVAKVEEEVPLPIIVKKQEVEKPSVPVKENYMPRINGVYNGEIAQSKMCGAGIDVNPSVHVLNFTIHYSTNRGDKALVVEGNKLPMSVCNEMQQYGIDQMIFITDIVGTDKNGRLLSFTSMNLTAVMD